MASSRLYIEGRKRFVEDAEARYHDKKDMDMLKDFLAQKGSPEEAREAAEALSKKAGEKWGAKKVGEAEIPAKWIDNLIGNIGNFVTVGNYAMKGAPESVGLAWFAVKLTLSAIESNYKLYALFGSALTDISEIMIIIPHYDHLYDERKAAAHADTKSTPMLEKMFQEIIQAYAAVLNFSWSVHHHMNARVFGKLRHGVKDFFGTSAGKFKDKISAIAKLKAKILEDSHAVFQDKTLQHVGAVHGIVNAIESQVSEIRNFQQDFQSSWREMNESFMLMLKTVGDINSSTKPKTQWEFAMQEFEKNKKILDPQVNTWGPLASAIKQRHPGTCNWIFESSVYGEWHTATFSSMLCIRGIQDCGKSTLIATIFEKLAANETNQTVVLYMNCGTTRGGAEAKAMNANMMCNTLLYQLYERATQDPEKSRLLEDCNSVFTATKKKSINFGGAMTQHKETEGLPDFTVAFMTIIARLNINVVVVLDETDRLDKTCQKELAARVKGIFDHLSNNPDQPRSVRFLTGCRLESSFYQEVHVANIPLRSVDVASYNSTDIETILKDELNAIPTLTQAEKTEAMVLITRQAASRFAYINKIAVPFMREPFQRPLTRRLQALPKSMNSVYEDFISKMSPNYFELLGTALTWTLLAVFPLRISEIMDIYQGTYNDRGPDVEAQARALVEQHFPRPSKLSIEQLHDASGPFITFTDELGGFFTNQGDKLVQLRDNEQIREYCLNKNDQKSAEASEGIHMCAKCMLSETSGGTLSISEKEGHLKLALQCMRSMNNPIFQRRVTGVDPVPLWSQPIELEAIRGIEGLAKLNLEEAQKEDTIFEEVSVQHNESMLDESTENVMNVNTHLSGDKGSLSDNMKDDSLLENQDETDSNYDSNESQEDEDEFDAEDISGTDQNADSTPVETFYRYEAQFWYFHIKKAEELWSPQERSGNGDWADLFRELDYWVSTPWFRRWQQKEGYAQTLFCQPLHIAASLDLTSWASHLLKNGADINLRAGEEQETPLEMAAQRVDTPEMLELLLEHNADPNAYTPHNLTPFYYWLYRYPDMESVQLWLKHGADPTIAAASETTALHLLGYECKDVAVLELLLDHTGNGIKADINVRDDAENTPLHIILLGQPDAPKPLLRAYIERGADVNAENSMSLRPLQLATLLGDQETVKILCHNKAISEIDDPDEEGGTALQEAAKRGTVKTVKYLVELGADVNRQDDRGKTALHMATWQKSKETPEVLLANGASLNVLDKHHRSPFFEACSIEDREEMTKFLLDTLLERNVPLAEINVLTKRRRSPIHQAASHGYEYIIDTLIKTAEAANDFASLALDERDSRKGMTPLHRAAWKGQTGCVRLLLAANANTGIEDNTGKTPLVLTYERWALESHEEALEDIISLLIDKDPKAAMVDAELVAICAVHGNLRLLQQLMAIGADLNCPDQYGWTPLDLAQKYQHEAVARFLKQQAVWAGKLPSRWVEDAQTEISQDGHSIKHTSGKRMCVTTNKPLPASLDKFYYEITLKTLSEADCGFERKFCWFSIGFCNMSSGSSFVYPGWLPRPSAPSARSWGFHGDDGILLYRSRDEKIKIEPDLSYGAGQTVGCGVDLTRHRMWFTLDGKKLENEFSNVHGRLFPLLGLKDKLEVQTNFTGPFLWKGDEEGGDEEVK